MGDFANAEALERWLLARGLTAKKASTTAATLFANGYDCPMSLLGVTIQELKDYAGLVGPIARELSNLLAKEDPQSAPATTMERGAQPPDELTNILKSMSISLHSIQETLPFVLSGHVVTPSKASQDRQMSASIFDALGLALRPTEDPIEYALPAEQHGQKEWVFNWKWPNQRGQDDDALERVFLPTRARFPSPAWIAGGKMSASVGIASANCCTMRILIQPKKRTRTMSRDRKFTTVIGYKVALTW